MANTHKFKVKNGLTTPNISFKDSHLGATITATMNDSTDTLSFEGNAGQLFSITDSLGGTLFAVSDISGIPSLEIDDQGIVRIAEFNGYLVVGGDSATGTKGVTIQSGAISIRTDSAPGYVDFYCETNNAHRVRLKSPAHAAYSGNIDVTLPVVAGTLLTADGVGTSLTALNASNLASGTIDSARLPLGVTFGGGGGTVTEAFKTIAVAGQSNVVADAAADTLTLVGGTNMTITTNAGGDTITFASSGGGGGSGTFASYTSNTTLAAFVTALANTSGGAFTLTLPASPSANDEIIILDAAGTFGTNNLTVGRNGNTIQGVSQDLVCDIDDVAIRLHYTGSDWRVYAIVGVAGGGAVTLSGTQTLTNKTLTNPSINNYTEGTVAIGNTGSTHTFSLTSGTFQTATLNANCTFTMPTAATGKSFVLKLTQGGSFTATFTNVKFAGGSAPTITTGSSKIDIISFISDGTNWYGNAIQDMS